MEKRSSLDVREESDLLKEFKLINSIVKKDYLSNLNDYKIIPYFDVYEKKPIYEHASLFKVQKIIYNKEENNIYKLINTYASMIGFGSNIVMIVDSDGIKTELYLGITGADGVSSARASSKALYKNLIGNFPGSLDEFEDICLDNYLLEALLEKCTNDNYSSVSIVSGVGSLRDEEIKSNESFVQGIEKMIDTMQGQPFSAIFISNVVFKDELNNLRAEYEQLYSNLVPFLKSDLTFNESSSSGISKTLSESLSKSITKSNSQALSTGTSKSNAHTEGHSVQHADSISVSHSKGRHTGAKGVGVSSNTTAGYSHSIAKSRSWSDTVTFGTTETQTKTIGSAKAEGEIKSKSNGTTETESTGRTLQISYQNKTVEQLLKKIDEQLQRIDESQNYGLFATAAYFLAQTPLESRMVASAYKAIINGTSTHVENATINSWDNKNNVDSLKKYIANLRHPEFIYDNINHVSPSTLVSGKELAIQMGLPRKSIPGVSVLEMASFGRNIEDSGSKNKIELGRLYHMGKEEQSTKGYIPVKLDLMSLTMHTFVTGSTGSGKSTAIYKILEEVMNYNDEYEENISFMVIEPAKGEYKHKFGHLNNVKVYGTNSKKTELLRVNPFSFPDDVHVLEHIDRLVEIFNVCWPMYAAMPAVLKDAIERAYISCGWDLGESQCKYKQNEKFLYPCFDDLLIQIEKVINESSYSSDSKSDYIGALSTRVRSLTNGLYSRIFTSNEISSVDLFDKNVIVDLSRVGSIETKSLIMGLLIIKMQEYRMSNQFEMNSNLKHLTVLEEAHNILKRTSTEQSSESSNLLGKSVEMLTNSIAEMRTYGEGFVIVDQSPGLLDMAAIRNTNTKIIMRLPEQSDRELVGRAASLNENQINELSKLRTGVAAIYQNNWLESILCKINMPIIEEKMYKISNQENSMNEIDYMKRIIDLLLMPINEKLDLNLNKLTEIEKNVFNSVLSSSVKVELLNYLDEKDPILLQEKRNSIMYNIFNSLESFNSSNLLKNNIKKWKESMVNSLIPNIESFDEDIKNKILAIITMEQAERDRMIESQDLFKNLMNHIHNT